MPLLHRLELEVELALGFQFARVLSGPKQDRELMTEAIEARH